MPLKIDTKYQREAKCAICSSGDFKIVYEFLPNRYDHGNFITHSWDGGMSVGLTIVKCKNCGFIYQNPIFKDEYLSLLYPESIIPERLDEKNYSENYSFYGIFIEPNLSKKENFAIDIGARFGSLSAFLQKKESMPLELK